MPRSPEGYGSDPLYYFDDEIAECACDECKPYHMCWPREMFGVGEKGSSRGCSMKTLACVRNEAPFEPKNGRDEKGRALKKDGKPKAQPIAYHREMSIESESNIKIIKRKKRHNETHAECSVVDCGWHPKEDFNKGAKVRYHRFEGDRGCVLMCRKHQRIRRAEFRKINPELYIEKWKRYNIEKAKNMPLPEKVYKRYCGNRKKQGDEVDITWEEWVSDYWVDTCPYFYQPFVNHSGEAREKGFKPGTIRFGDSPSIDRIDSSKPYQKDNIEVVSTRWNLLKSNSTVEERFAMGKEAALKIGYKWPPEPAEL